MGESRKHAPSRDVPARGPDVHVAIATLGIAVTVLGLAGCPVPDRCDQTQIEAIADDQAAPGPTYVVRTVTFEEGIPYALGRADRAAPLVTSAGDGTPIELLTPTSGGVIVVGGGAAARRFDAMGALAWAVGYGAAVGAHGALVAEDRMIVGDETTVRALSLDGAIVWERALGAQTTNVSQVVADRAGGAWVVGAFQGAFPPWVTVATRGTTATVGHFVFRFDAAGAVVSANAWDNTEAGGLSWTRGLAVARGDATELVLTGGANPGSGAVPALGLDRGHANGPFAVAFDEACARLWTLPLGARVDLAADPDGNLFALSADEHPPVGPAGPSVVDGLRIERLDANGVPLAPAARATFAMKTTKYGHLTWASAPTQGGLVIAADWVAQSETNYDFCPGRPSLFRFETTTLAFTSLPGGLP